MIEPLATGILVDEDLRYHPLVIQHGKQSSSFSDEFLDHPRNRHFDIATGDSQKVPAIYLQTKARVLYNHRVISPTSLHHVLLRSITRISGYRHYLKF